MNIDHMLVDGFSYMQVFDELFNTYDRMVLGEPWELPEAAMTFGDYVRVENLRQRIGNTRTRWSSSSGCSRICPPRPPASPSATRPC